MCVCKTLGSWYLIKVHYFVQDMNIVQALATTICEHYTLWISKDYFGADVEKWRLE